MKRKIAMAHSRKTIPSQFSLAVTIILTVVVAGGLWGFFRWFGPFSSVNPYQWGASLVRTQTMTSDAVIPLDSRSQITTALLSGTAKLNSGNSLVRVIIVDNQGNEYLVYEANSALNDVATNLSLNNACEETCAFGPIMPVSLKVKITDGSLTIGSLTLNKPKSYSPEAKSTMFNAVQNTKLNAVKSLIVKKHMTWTAGETWVSKLSYAQKKKLFTNPDGTPVKDLPNLQGFEYYKGGVFSLGDTSNVTKNALSAKSPAASGLPESWDWRNVMGQNWNTSVKHQGSTGNCWAFAALSTLESQINLYYGQHLDLNLSEQQFADCGRDPNVPNGMAITAFPDCLDCGCNFCVINKHGIADENCDPYAGRDWATPHCSDPYVCSNWQERTWKNAGYSLYVSQQDNMCPSETVVSSADDFKKILVSKGPVSTAWWGHAVELVGYGKVSDWRIIEDCTSSGKVCTNQGCISPNCPNNEGITYYCTYTPDSSLISAGGCNSSNQWGVATQSCSADRICVQESNNTAICKLKNETTFSPGYRACFDSRYYSEYSPGVNGGISYWLFKNSWGNDWGENGYGKIDASLINVSVVDLPIGPYTPPTSQAYWPAGFTNSPSPWFYTQTCDNSGIGPNYTVRMGFQNGQQSTASASCPSGQVCQSTDSAGFVICGTSYCNQLYSKIQASWQKSCGDSGYDPVADIDKTKYVDYGDLSFLSANIQNETWCQQKLNDTTNPCLIQPSQPNCANLYSKIQASWQKSCGGSGYDPVADIDKTKYVDYGDLSFLSANIQNETWCQQQLGNTANPCSSASSLGLSPIPSRSTKFKSK